MLEGIDVSHHNAGAVPTKGLSFIFAKATQGLGFSDPAHAEHITETTGAGLIPGSYGFLEAANGAAQCDYFLDHVGVVKGPHLFAVDVERYGDHEQYHPAPADLVAWHTRFHQRMPGRKLFVYSYHSFWLEAFGGYLHTCPMCVLWSSSIQQAWPPPFGGFPVVTLHQYDTTGIDKDRFTGSRAQLEAYGTRNVPVVPLPPGHKPIPAGPTPLLTIGMVGPRVTDVQHALDLRSPANRTAHFDGMGHFGHRTQMILKRFQSHQGIPPSGTVTPATWAALRAVAHPRGK